MHGGQPDPPQPRRRSAHAVRDADACRGSVSLPQAVAALAYADQDVPLGNGRYMMEPMVFARLLQAARLRDNEQVLVVGAGTGYGAAVLAACGCRVTALEEDPALLAIAGAVLSR